MTAYRERMLNGDYDANKQSLGRSIGKASASFKGGAGLVKQTKKTAAKGKRSGK